MTDAGRALLRGPTCAQACRWHATSAAPAPPRQSLRMLIMRQYLCFCTSKASKTSTGCVFEEDTVEAGL